MPRVCIVIIVTLSLRARALRDTRESVACAACVFCAFCRRRDDVASRCCCWANIVRASAMPERRGLTIMFSFAIARHRVYSRPLGGKYVLSFFFFLKHVIYKELVEALYTRLFIILIYVYIGCVTTFYTVLSQHSGQIF